MSEALATDLLARLPHGPGFRFVDELLEIEPGVRGVGRWSVRGDEPFFAGHFPGNPIVPGVLIGEALAQLSGVVGLGDPAHNGSERGQGVLAHLDVRLKKPVAPPADIELHSTVTRLVGPLGQFDVQARYNGAVVARGSLTLASTT